MGDYNLLYLDSSLPFSELWGSTERSGVRQQKWETRDLDGDMNVFRIHLREESGGEVVLSKRTTPITTRKLSDELEQWSQYDYTGNIEAMCLIDECVQQVIECEVEGGVVSSLSFEERELKLCDFRLNC